MKHGKIKKRTHRMPNFFYDKKIPTFIVLIWAILLTTWVVWRVFGETPPSISMGTATSLATVFGLPTLAASLWKWRNKE